MDTPSALTDDFASEVEYNFTSPNQQLLSVFPELGPTDYLDTDRFVDEFSSPEFGFIDPTFTTKMDTLESVTYNTGASRTPYGGTHEDSSGPRQGDLRTSHSSSSDSQADTEQQHGDQGVIEGQAGTVQTIEGNPTSSEYAFHNLHDPSSPQRDATEQSSNLYTPVVHSNPETPRLPLNSSFDVNSPMLSRTYSQHSIRSLATESGSLGRHPRRTTSYPTDYIETAGASTLHDSSGQSYTQLPMPNAVARLHAGGVQNIHRGPRTVLGSSPMTTAADVSSVDRHRTPDYSHHYGQASNTPRYPDFPQTDFVGYQTRPSYASLDPTSQVNRLGYGAPNKGNYGSPSQRSYQPQAYNNSRGQLYQTSSLSGNNDRASSSPYLGHTARAYNPPQSLLQGFGSAEQETLKFEDDEVKLTEYANLDDARRHNIPDHASGPVPHDPTIPESDNEKQRIVAKIVAAMNDMSKPEDNAPMVITWRNVLANQVKGQLEHIAWQILERCITRHKQKGPLTANSKPNHHYENFEKRIVDILRGLRTQKTMCKHLLVPPYIDSLIDNPGYATSRIENNRRVNKAKKTLTEKARALVEGKTQGKSKRVLSVKEEDTNDEDGDYDEDDDVALTAFDAVDASSNRLTSIGQRTKTTQSQAKTSRKRKATSEGVLDPSFTLPARKSRRAPRPNQSVYKTEENLDFNTSAAQSQNAYEIGTFGTGQQGRIVDYQQGDEDYYVTSNSGQVDPSQGQLSPDDEAILKQLLQAQETSDMLNPGNRLAEGEFVQGEKIIRHDPATGAPEILHENFLESPLFSRFSPFFPHISPFNPGSGQGPYAPTSDLQAGSAQHETRSSARTRRAAVRTPEQNTQYARQPPYGYRAVAPDDEPVSTLQKAPAGRKRSRR